MSYYNASFPTRGHQTHGDFLYTCSKYINNPTSTRSDTISWSYGSYSDSATIEFDELVTTTQFSGIDISSQGEITDGDIVYEFLCHVLKQPNGSYVYSGNSTETVNFAATSENTFTRVVTIYRKRACTLSFDANGGTGAPSSIDFLCGDTVTIPDGIPVKDGFTFAGWKNGASVYQPGDSIRLTSSATLVAIWSDSPVPPHPVPTGSGLLSCNSGSGTLAFSPTSGFLVYN